MITSERKNRQVRRYVCVWRTGFRVVINLPRAPYHPRPIGVGPHPHPKRLLTACETETPISGCGGDKGGTPRVRCPQAERRTQLCKHRVPQHAGSSTSCPNSAPSSSLSSLQLPPAPSSSISSSSSLSSLSSLLRIFLSPERHSRAKTSQNQPKPPKPHPSLYTNLQPPSS